MLATAKIHILKQFTTIRHIFFTARLLCLLLQRYTFWSNSQPKAAGIKASRNCACYCKDTHFEAIHNALRTLDIKIPIVLATAKIHILKQFTTRKKEWCFLWKLCLLLQRYTFWSNSQRHVLYFCYFFYCACYCKDTHFEAIHNLLRLSFRNSANCACYCKDTHFEAIHNYPYEVDAWIQLCLLLQRYTFWSNSQQILNKILDGDIVLATAKIHILKQFTTGGEHRRGDNHCACYCKDTHFEAIHN